MDIAAQVEASANYDEITDTLLLGGKPRSEEFLREFLGVEAVLTCAAELEPLMEGKKLAIDDDVGFDITPYLVEGIRYLESVKGKRVYVHCAAGVSRSGSVVVAYIMWRDRKGLSEALKWVRERRQCVAPNEAFIKQLKDFSEKLVACDYAIDSFS